MLARPDKTIPVRRLATAPRLTKTERQRLNLPPEPKRKLLPAPPITAHPHLYVWFAFVTAPQQEAKAAEDIYYRLGFNVVNALENVEVRACRQLRFRRKQRARPILTSMVLAGFKAGVGWRTINGRYREVRQADVPWLDLFALPSVVGVVCMGQVPVPVPTANVIELIKADGRMARPRNWAPAVGEAARIEVGTFAGQRGTIVHLDDGEAAVQLTGLEGMFADLAEPAIVPETWLGEPGVM